MNEYLIRFNDGSTKHIIADKCKFAMVPNVELDSDVVTAYNSKPMAIFYRNDKIIYVINLDSLSAIRFPEVKDDELNTSDGDT